MDILDQEMKVEKQDERLDRIFAKEASDDGTSYIFSWLADQEKKHYDVFSRIKDLSIAPIERDSLFKTVFGIFSGWKNTRAKLNVKTTQVDLYRKALEVEGDSIRLYEEGAKMADNGNIRSMFLQIVTEEKEHQRVMENIIEFVSKPETWFENAEFGYRGENYYL